MTARRVPIVNTNPELHRRELAQAINRVISGQMDNYGAVTLTVSATTTVVTDARMSVDGNVLLMPTTANAAGAITTTYVSARDNGSFTLTHASAASTDRTFGYVIIA